MDTLMWDRTKFYKHSFQKPRTGNGFFIKLMVIFLVIVQMIGLWSWVVGAPWVFRIEVSNLKSPSVPEMGGSSYGSLLWWMCFWGERSPTSFNVGQPNPEWRLTITRMTRPPWDDRSLAIGMPQLDELESPENGIHRIGIFLNHR